MPTIIVCFFPVLLIEIREKLKSQQRTKRAENLHKHAHAAMQSFQPMLLTPNFCTKRYALSGHFS